MKLLTETTVLHLLSACAPRAQNGVSPKRPRYNSGLKHGFGHPGSSVPTNKSEKAAIQQRIETRPWVR